METEQAQFVQQGMRPRTPETWIGRLSLHNFRNYAHASLVTEPRPVVLVGHNGAGKTNILEAVSMVSPGRGLRRAAPADLTCAGAEADRLGNSPAWSISAKLHTKDDAFTIGTGLALTSQSSASASRVVRIDGEQQRSANVLADYVEMSWLTPASDGLFTGAASDRRRFLDRLVLCFDPQHGTRSNRFDRAMRQRNKLLDLGARSDAEFAGLEDVLAETGVAIAAARSAVVDRLTTVITQRRDTRGETPFPFALVDLDGSLELDLRDTPASDAEDAYRQRLADNRGRDRAAKRTLEGPHRTDFLVTHGPKSMPARLCSTGEQKALLVGLVLAHAEMLGGRAQGSAPILLLDEIAAHLDSVRRAALFEEILALGTQAWMTGTDRTQFAALEDRADIFTVSDGTVSPVQ